MGRHAETRPSRRPALPVLIAAGVVVALLAGGLVWWLVGSGGDCDDRRTVAVTVASWARWPRTGFPSRYPWTTAAAPSPT
jgi:predicted alpha/beta hydrolase